MPDEYTAMLVDDEPEALEFLSGLIRDHCPGLKILSSAGSSKEAIKNYFEWMPQLLFLDIRMDAADGFTILNEIYGRKFRPYVIFVTGFEEYAVKAFREDAIDFLLKPVEPAELMHAVKKFKDQYNKDQQYKKISDFINQYRRRIRFNTREGFIVLDAKEILYCEADRNYSKLYLVNGSQEIISMNLGGLEDKLPSGIFKRISKSYIINSEYLYKVYRKKKTCTLIHNGNDVILPASRKKLLQMEI